MKDTKISTLVDGKWVVSRRREAQQGTVSSALREQPPGSPRKRRPRWWSATGVIASRRRRTRGETGDIAKLACFAGDRAGRVDVLTVAVLVQDGNTPQGIPLVPAMTAVSPMRPAEGAKA